MKFRFKKSYPDMTKNLIRDRPTLAQRIVWRMARIFRRKPKCIASPKPNLPSAPPFSVSTSTTLSCSSQPNNATGTKDYRTLLKFYSLKETIGEGTFGKVKKAIHKTTHETVAVKIIKKGMIGDELPRVHREIKALKLLDHPYISQLYQIIETSHNIFIVMEFCECGDLYDYIRRKKRVKEEKAQKIFRQLASAVNYVHEKGISHRDLKPENVLLDGRGDIKLIDFNLSNFISAKDLFRTHCGTIEYAAPELLRGQHYDGRKSDAWSLGAVLYVTLCGRFPFEDPGMRDKIKTAYYYKPRALSVESEDLIDKLLTVDPEKRLSVREMLLHPWLNAKTGGGIRTPKVSPKTSGDDWEELDNEILSLMSSRLSIPMDNLRASVSSRFNNNDFATFMILLKKRKVFGDVGFAKWSSKWVIKPSVTNMFIQTDFGIQLL